MASPCSAATGKSLGKFWSFPLALTPDTNQTFYREVDEELRKERLGSFWQRYGKWIAAALVLLLAAGIGYALWRNAQTKEAAAQSEVLEKVITDLGSGQEANVAPQLATLKASDSEGYRAAALLTEADLLLGKGNAAAAASAFGRIAADTSLPQPYRDLALVRQTAAEFDTVSPAVVIARLTPLARPGNPWFGSAGEMVGAAYLKQGKPERAAPLFAAVARDEGVPETIRARTVQMAGTLGVDAIQDRPDGGATPSSAATQAAPSPTRN
ncbi:MAG TPA: tetratricopeptide repeat protein [Sphingomonadaceae bacterium]|nr:tetratricopeptide repeat protein [Sphingomonadaceae bacterium]